MSKVYRFLRSTKNSNVFAVTTNSKELLSIHTASINAPNAVSVGRYGIVINEPFTIPKPVGCDDACTPTKTVDLSVGVNLSGPYASKAILIARLERITDGLKTGKFDTLFEGFPTNATDVYTLID